MTGVRSTAHTHVLQVGSAVGRHPQLALSSNNKKGRQTPARSRSFAQLSRSKRFEHHHFRTHLTSMRAAIIGEDTDIVEGHIGGGILSEVFAVKGSTGLFLGGARRNRVLGSRQ